MKKVSAALMIICIVTAYMTFGMVESNAIEINLNNPVVTSEDDEKMITWDTVYFGSYPQTEIVEESNQSINNNVGWKKYSDYEVDAELYRKLETATYDENNDVKIDGIKYRRISSTSYNQNTSFYSSDDNINAQTYYYFRYDDIKWRVININDKEALLLSDIVLDCKEYDEVIAICNEPVSWYKSSIREWLNDTFLQTAFSYLERNSIKETNTEYGISDKVFLLSKEDILGEDAEKFGFGGESNDKNKARTAQSSSYAKAMGATVSVIKANDDYCVDRLNSDYFLRTCSGYDSACVVFEDGEFGSATNTISIGVRPVICFDLDYIEDLCYGGKVSSDGSIDLSECNYIGGKYIKTVAPTCIEQGYDLYGKSKEGIYRTNFVEATGKHNFERSVIAPTCTEDGYTELFCSLCGKTVHTDMKCKLGHNYEKEKVVDPTCVEDGYTVYKCVRCEKSYKDNITEATGLHDYNMSVVSPENGEKGYQIYECKNCDNIFSDECTCESGIHMYVDKIIEPTYSSNGYVLHKCSICNKYYKSDYFGKILPLGKVNLKSAVLSKYNSVKVSWKKVTGADGYYVWYKKSSASSWLKKSVTGLSASFNSLSTGTEYNFKVQAYVKNDGKVVNIGDESSLKKVNTLKKLASPVVKRNSSKKVKISWAKVTGATGYEISKTTSKSKTTKIATVTKGKTTTKVIVAKNGIKYYYKVRAYKVVDGKKIYAPWSAVKAYKLSK